MIARDQIVHISGQFSGAYQGKLFDGIKGAINQRAYEVNILPNSMLTKAHITDNSFKPSFEVDAIRLNFVSDVNVFLQSGADGPNYISKEQFYDVVITDYQISESGKDGHETHGQLTGNFYGIIRPAKVSPKQPLAPNTVSTNNMVSNTFNSPEPLPTPVLPQLPSWGWRGCWYRFFQLFGLLLCLLFLLSKCNSCRPIAPLPLPLLDSLSEEYTDTMSLQNSNAYITFNDWDRADNDRITVKLNNEVIAKNMLISNALQTIQIKQLHRGNNKLEIIPTAFGKGNCTVNVEIGDSRNIFRFNCNIKKGETVIKNILVK